MNKEKKEKEIKIALIDVEASDGKNEVSEVYIGIYTIKDNGLVCVDEFHRLIKIRWPMYDLFIARDITGLTYEMLQQCGVSFLQMIKELKRWIQSYPNVTWYARDPKMEQRTIGRHLNVEIHEFCDILVMPFQKLYRTEAGRKHLQLPLYEHCGYHQQKYKHHMCHCAKRDVWWMAETWKNNCAHKKL